MNDNELSFEQKLLSLLFLQKNRAIVKHCYDLYHNGKTKFKPKQLENSFFLNMTLFH